MHLGSFFGTPALTQFRTDVTDEDDHYLLETDKKDKVIRMERSYGAYQRSFDISGVDADKIKAKYVDGVLRLTLPKLEQRLPEGRHLEIE